MTKPLDQSAYPAHEFSSVYHGRWGIEELYKISKVLIDVENFHSKSERGVKQECSAHLLLVNLARIFELEADQQIPPRVNNQKEAGKEDKKNYWQDFCGKIHMTKSNFKNCLLVIGRNLIALLSPDKYKQISCLSSVLNSIARVRQRIRPGRHVPRRSRKPRNKWSNSNSRALMYA